MQFVKRGPEVPEHLIQAHEEGRVVFFCGAGVSYPAGLPGFDGLVEALFERLFVAPNRLQNAAIHSGQYDTAIMLLEDDYPEGRWGVRRELANLLLDTRGGSGATKTHERLLELSMGPHQKTRLITTNFDRLFCKAADRLGINPNSHSAPYLPIPKNRWDGIVYLHGLLPEDPSEIDLDSLVLSSGDFGLAYLTERWASRFVSELFRQYTVCFVGYSLSDPVLRYMTDALAADRQRGERHVEMFAFASCPPGRESEVDSEWRAKNVTPILYRETKTHLYLHRTIHQWAAMYRDGIRGKEQIIMKEAGGDPSATTAQDDFVRRVLWALSDSSGLPARRFAELSPAPPFEWIGPLLEERYGRYDLARFGVG